MRPLNIFLISVFSVLSVVNPSYADDFADKVDLAPLRSLTVQHEQTLKTLDTFSRQVLYTVTGRGTLDGQDPVYTVLDMAYRPQQYVHRNLIKIRNVPLREDVAALDGLDPAEQKRIVHDGKISLAFWIRPAVQKLMEKQQSSAVFKAQAIGQTALAASTLDAMLGGGMNGFFPPVAAVAPPKGDSSTVWHQMSDLAGNLPQLEMAAQIRGGKASPAVAGYDAAEMKRLDAELFKLANGWQNQDAAAVNAAAESIGDLLPRVNPAVYPSALKRSAEVIYNRLAKLTIPGAAVYFAAFVLFLMAGRSGFGGLRIWGLRLMVVALLLHTTGIGVRWWLVEKNTGDWFHAIPIKNQFESVLFSAWFGALLALILELRRGRGMFGAAGCFVGWLSLVALFASPYVFGREIGGEISQAQGVLMSYWLYVHVTLVTASYALIGMGFCLSVWWLVRYYAGDGTARGFGVVNPRQLNADAVRDEPDFAEMSGGAAVLQRGILPALSRVFFLRRPEVSAALPHGRGARATEGGGADFLARLDQCNVVVLQLAFWVLGVGIICGAVWADMSWGRPWGWDPKETFALVTWIVYLIVVHVRVVTPHKAWWTAVLSVVGFGVMLFNWIGVNFFLVGLHSYA